MEGSLAPGWKAASRRFASEAEGFTEEHEAIAEKMRERYADQPWYADAVIADEAIAAADHWPESK